MRGAYITHKPHSNPFEEELILETRDENDVLTKKQYPINVAL